MTGALNTPVHSPMMIIIIYYSLSANYWLAGASPLQSDRKILIKIFSCGSRRLNRRNAGYIRYTNSLVQINFIS